MVEWNDRNFLMFSQDKCKVLHLGWNNPLLGLGGHLLESRAASWEWAGWGLVDHPFSSEGELHVELC